MEQTTNGNDPPRRRKAPAAAKVKVVASRYAQAMQRSNLDGKAAPVRAVHSLSDRQGRAIVASSSSSGSSVKVTAANRGASVKSAPQTRTIAVASAHMPVPSTPAVAPPATGRSTGPSSGESSEGAGINERLRLYRASKAAQRQGGRNVQTRTVRSAPASVSISASTSGPTDSLRSGSRPGLPDRITPPSDKTTAKNVARTSSTANGTPATRRVKTPTSTRYPGTPGTTPAMQSMASTAPAYSQSNSSSSASRIPMPQIEEELELLECMYLQLCFSEAKADAAFRRQEQSAERQILAVWNILQSKLQLLHDTSIRLDRELHVHRIEEHLGDQAEPFVRLASRVGSFAEDLSVLCRSLAGSLQRMPTPGVVCSSPELKRQLEALASTLVGLQAQFEADGAGSTISAALQFEQRMEESTEKTSALLLQVGNLLEELQQELSTETSVAAHSIQTARLEQAMEQTSWW